MAVQYQSVDGLKMNGSSQGNGSYLNGHHGNDVTSSEMEEYEVDQSYKDIDATKGKILGLTSYSSRWQFNKKIFSNL